MVRRLTASSSVGRGPRMELGARLSAVVLAQVVRTFEANIKSYFAAFEVRAIAR